MDNLIGKRLDGLYEVQELIKVIHKYVKQQPA